MENDSNPIPRQAGFTLIEIAVVMVIVGIVISIVATVLPSLVRSSKIKQGRAVIEKVDYAIQGYITANGRLPFADNGTTGVEDSATPTYFGNLPYVTLGLSSGDDAWGNRIKYGVHTDLTATDSTTFGSAIATSCPDPANTAYLHVRRTSGSVANMAYVIVSGGPQDLDLDGSFFDDLNDDDNAEYDDPVRIVTGTYDDLMIARSCNEVSGIQGYGGGSGTGTSGTGVENTSSLCSDGIDNDSDGLVDCHDQDCCGSGLTICPDGCPPPTDVAIVTSPATLTATIGRTGYSHTFQATGGSGYYYWYVDAITPSISGLDINLTSGALTGTINACEGDYNIDVRVEDRYDSAKTDSHTFTITVSTGTLSISPAPSGLGVPADFTVSTSVFTQEFSISGDYVGPFASTSPSAWSIQWLDEDPGGFQIDPVSNTTAQLRKSAGTTSRANPYPFTLTATDDSCPTNSFTTGTYTLEITPAGVGAPYSANLVAEWRMDECSWDGTIGEVHDNGTSLLDGTAMNGATTTGAGKNCSAGFFDGVDDYVTVSNNSELQRTGNFSIALWVKVHTDAADWVRLAGKGDSTNRNYGLWLAITGRVLFQIYSDGGDGNAQSSITINDGNWHHIAGVYDQSTMKLYIDDVERASVSYSQVPRTSEDPFTMGYAGFHAHLDGLLDEVMLFHSALTAEEVSEIYQITRSSCSGSCYTDPVAEYRMENFPWNGAADEVEDTGTGESHGIAAALGTGSLPAQTTPSSGKICRAGTFTRVDANNGGYLDIGDPADGDLDPGTDPWTISAWVKWDGSTGENIIYNKENLYEARVYNGYVQYAWQPHWVWDGGNSFPITADTWTYLTLVYDGYRQTLYKDGSSVYSRTQTGAMGANNSRMLIGARGSAVPRNFFGGQIDELTMYDRALAENEIAADLASTRSCTADTVVITSTSLPGATVGETGWTSGADPAATGGTTPYVWEIIAQEGGLSLTMPDVSTGVLSGDIDVCAGTYNISLRVTDNSGNIDEITLPLIVTNGTLSLSGISSPLNCTETTCNWPLTVSGPAIGTMASWTINWQGAGPGGFEVISTGDNTATFRKISTSTASNGYQFYLTATDSACGDNILTTGSYTLNVSSGATDSPYYAGMVAEWRFDECSWNGTAGEITDTASDGLDGTAAGGASTAAGKRCRAGIFDGVDDYADMGNILNDVLGTTSGAFTVSAWIKPYSLGTAQTNHATRNCFVAKASDAVNDNLEIGVNPDGRLHVYLDTTNRNSQADFGNAGDIALNQWSFVAVSYDGSTVTATINGTAYTNTTTWNGGGDISSADGSPLTIGSSQHTDNYFHGKIDEVRFHDSALSASEIATLYGLSRTCSGACEPVSVIGSPIGEWHLDECTWDGTADEILDTSGQDAHGRSYNAAAGDGIYRAVGHDCRSAAFNLDGVTNQYAELGAAAFNSLNDFSLALWFRLDALNSSLNVLFSGASAAEANSMLLYLNATATSFISHVNGTQTGTFAIGAGLTDGLWHHVVWTRQMADGSEVIYLDGSALSDSNGAADTDPATLDAGGAVIGQEQDSLGGGFDVNQNFHGWIDEVRLYNQVLSQSDADLLRTDTRDCAGSCYTSPVAFYRIESDFSDVIGGYNGTAAGSAAVDTTDGCNSGLFANNDSQVSMAGLPVSTDAGDKTTVTFWMNWGGHNAEMPIGWERYDLYFYNNTLGFNTACGDVFGVDISGSLDVMIDNWHHVAAIFTNNDASANQLFIDGVLQPSTLLQGTPCSRTVTADFHLSGWGAGAGYYYDGKIDEVRIYTRGLSTSEINEDMQSGHSCE